MNILIMYVYVRPWEKLIFFKQCFHFGSNNVVNRGEGSNTLYCVYVTDRFERYLLYLIIDIVNINLL